MKRLVLASLLLATPAFAQAPLAPVTLSPAEYQQLMQVLAQRDPAMAFLMQKEAEAQRGAATMAQHQVPTPKPHEGTSHAK